VCHNAICYAEWHSTECRFDDCYYVKPIMLKLWIVLSVVLFNGIMLCVVLLSVFILGVVAPLLFPNGTLISFYSKSIFED